MTRPVCRSRRRDSAQRRPAQRLGSTTRTPIGDHDQEVLLIFELHDGRPQVARHTPIRNTAAPGGRRQRAPLTGHVIISLVADARRARRCSEGRLGRPNDDRLFAVREASAPTADRAHARQARPRAGTPAEGYVRTLKSRRRRPARGSASCDGVGSCPAVGKRQRIPRQTPAKTAASAPSQSARRLVLMPCADTPALETLGSPCGSAL